MTLAQARKIDSDILQLYILDNFLSPAECDQILYLMTLHSVPSTLTIDTPDMDFRTSRTTYLGHLNHPFVKLLEQKIADTVGVNLAYSESIQAQRYDVGAQFKLHTDYFEPNSPEFQKFAGLQGNRTWTFMIYLNKVEAGGETYFSEINKKITPEVGKAVIWNNLLPNGQVNPNTRHAGLPVKAGYKAIVNKWFRQKLIT